MFSPLHLNKLPQIPSNFLIQIHLLIHGIVLKILVLIPFVKIALISMSTIKGPIFRMINTHRLG